MSIGSGAMKHDNILTISTLSLDLGQGYNVILQPEMGSCPSPPSSGVS